MRFLDATLCIALASQIHGTDEAIRRTARSCAAKMTSQRDRRLIMGIVNSKKPTLHVAVMLQQMPDYILQMNLNGKPPMAFKTSKSLTMSDPEPSVSAMSPLAAFLKR
ncbi:hypothetical protein IFT48_02815 [Pseudomonas fluorescens]|uniref:DUF7740 domain-containing protein n=1 Tax=Pseudomonas TaxID=286 RepID=UPI000F0402A9|nr:MULTISPECIES: hypothetical protein [Pseudomonas]MBD8088898.1 hypothetical protein [Pseudomonas fluorescens]MBD8615667.1 hypothetical protein [Pseudomonas putida]MBD8681677.1 hypothetical protein [Pseudomonas sp. CFBP 13719]